MVVVVIRYRYVRYKDCWLKCLVNERVILTINLLSKHIDDKLSLQQGKCSGGISSCIEGEDE